MKYLLDTCVISELPNQRPNPKVIHWLKIQDPETLYLSFVTIGEIKKGLVKLGDSPRVLILETWFEDEILKVFENAFFRSINPFLLRGAGYAAKQSALAGKGLP